MQSAVEQLARLEQQHVEFAARHQVAMHCNIDNNFQREISERDAKVVQLENQQKQMQEFLGEKIKDLAAITGEILQ